MYLLTFVDDGREQTAGICECIKSKAMENIWEMQTNGKLCDKSVMHWY